MQITKGEPLQFDCVLRQHERTDQATHFTRHDTGVDPRTGRQLTLSRDVFPLETYEAELGSYLRPRDRGSGFRC
jgi:hypothetical protein